MGVIARPRECVLQTATPTLSQIDSETWAILPIDGTQQKIQAKNTITINFCGVTDAPEEVVASLETVFGHGPNFTTQDAANKLSSGYCPFLPVVSPPPPPHGEILVSLLHLHQAKGLR